MARTVLAVTSITRLGVDSATTLEAANVDGESILNNSAMFVEILNGNAADCNVTVQTPRTVDGLAVAELAVVVSQNERMFIGPFPSTTFNQTGGVIYVDFDTVTDVTIAAWKLG